LAEKLRAGLVKTLTSRYKGRRDFGKDRKPRAGGHWWERGVKVLISVPGPHTRNTLEKGRGN